MMIVNNKQKNNDGVDKLWHYNQQRLGWKQPNTTL